jgi:hypothetical protein
MDPDEQHADCFDYPNHKSPLNEAAALSHQKCMVGPLHLNILQGIGKL